MQFETLHWKLARKFECHFANPCNSC